MNNMGSRHKGCKSEKRALDTLIKLARATESVMACVARVIAGSNLTPGQFGVIEAIYHLGPLDQVSLGKKILKSGGNITMIIDNLERRGLVARMEDRRDRRRNIVRLTRKGRSVIKTLFPKVARGAMKSMNSLSAPEHKELGALLKKLGACARESVEKPGL